MGYILHHQPKAMSLSPPPPRPARPVTARHKRTVYTAAIAHHTPMLKTQPLEVAYHLALDDVAKLRRSLRTCNGAHVQRTQDSLKSALMRLETTRHAYRNGERAIDPLQPRLGA